MAAAAAVLALAREASADPVTYTFTGTAFAYMNSASSFIPFTYTGTGDTSGLSTNIPGLIGYEVVPLGSVTVDIQGIGTYSASSSGINSFYLAAAQKGTLAEPYLLWVDATGYGVGNPSYEHMTGYYDYGTPESWTTDGTYSGQVDVAFAGSPFAADLAPFGLTVTSTSNSSTGYPFLPAPTPTGPGSSPAKRYSLDVSSCRGIVASQPTDIP